MKLTENGENFFYNCSVREFGEDEIQLYGVTDRDLMELEDFDYIMFDERTGTYKFIN